MMGMPPATAASKWMAELCWSERAKSSSPRSARRALLPVTTVFPSLRAAATMSNAVVVPPMSSTTMSTAGSFTTSFQSEVKRCCGGVIDAFFGDVSDGCFDDVYCELVV